MPYTKNIYRKLEPASTPYQHAAPILLLRTFVLMIIIPALLVFTITNVIILSTIRDFLKREPIGYYLVHYNYTVQLYDAGCRKGKYIFDHTRQRRDTIQTLIYPLYTEEEYQSCVNMYIEYTKGSE